MLELVGILNVTPDSFSDGGLFDTPESALAQAQKLFDDGASLIDVGAESTAPGSTPISAEEEWARLAPILPPLLDAFRGKISVDTYHAATAEKAIQLGVGIINDVTGLSDPAMADTIVKHKARIVVGNLPGGNLHEVHNREPIYDIKDVVQDLLPKAQMLESKGLPRQNIILDPGIGFGKTKYLNQELLSFAKAVPGYQVMIGYSRKRFLGEHRMELEPNLEAGKIATKAGTYYLRVHDVAGHKQLLY